MGAEQTAHLLDDSWICPCLNSNKFRVNMRSVQTAYLPDDSWIRPCLNSKLFRVIREVRGLHICILNDSWIHLSLNS
jgi:hypothetical protein